MNLKRISPAFVYLLLSAVIGALGTPIVKWMIIHGGPYGVSRPGAVSFCNILFVGNLFAALYSILFFGPRKIFREIKNIHLRGWGTIAIVTLLSATSATLIFASLTKLTVINVVLIQRLDGIFYVFIAFLIFQEKPNTTNLISYLFIFFGISLEIFFVNKGKISGPTLWLIIGTALYAAKPVFNKIIMRTISAECMLFLVKLISAIIFFVIAIQLYGQDHFADLMKGRLWLGISVYGLFIVFIGALLLYRGVQLASTQLLTNMKLLTPIASIFFAFLLLGENPSIAEWIAVAIVIVGSLIGQIKIQKLETHLPQNSPLRADSVDRALIGQ